MRLLDTDIYAAPIDPSAGRSLRREAERTAVAHLIRQVFGASAHLMHCADGAPYIGNGHDVHISISHAADIALLAVNRTERVGIDVEYARRALLNVADRFLTPAELTVTGRHTGALLQAWTLKEALFKAGAGSGQARGITLIDVPLPGSWRPEPGDDISCVMAVATVSGHHASVCVRGGVHPAELFGTV